MSTVELPAALARDATEIADQAQGTESQWVETALVVLFAVASILFASFLAVVTGLA